MRFFRPLRPLLTLATTLVFVVAIALPTATDARTAVIVGDSQAVGLDGPLAASLDGYDVNVVGTAVQTGYTTNRVIRELDVRSLVSSRNPDLIIAIVGGNDSVGTTAAQRSSYEGILSNALVAMGGAANYAKIVWVGPAFSRDSGVQALHDRTSTAQQAFFSRLGVRWIDGRTGSRAGPYQQDSNPGTTESQIRNRNTHFTNAGYRRWACELAPQIVNQPASGSCPTTGAEADIAFPDVPGDVGAPVAGSDASFSTTCDENAGPVPITLGVSVGGVNEVSGLPEYINTVYRYLVSIILVIAIVMVVYGGFLYLTGAAGMGSVQRGKQIIKDALIGMVIVLTAFAILQTISSGTTVLKLDPGKIECVAIAPIARNPNADEGGANIPSCVKDSQCREGRVCLRTQGTEGLSSGQCTQGRANELCRCSSGGCDVTTSEDGSPTNNNGTKEVACQVGTCQEITGISRCLTGEGGSVCDMHADPPIPCAAGNFCQQGNQDQPGRCVARNYSDQSLTPRPVCSTLGYGPGGGDRYYRESHIISDWEGGCLRVGGSGVDDFCMRNRYRCSPAAAANLCSEEEFATLFGKTGNRYNSGIATSWDFNRAPENLKPWNYARFGCRKPIGASCTSDQECSSMCVSGTCSGFCVIRPSAGTPTESAGSILPRRELESACTPGCSGTTWSAAEFGINFSGPYLGVPIDGLDVVSPMTVQKAACYPVRPNNSKCDFNGQCQSGACRFDSGASGGAFASFSAPLDMTAGIGTCTP